MNCDLIRPLDLSLRVINIQKWNGVRGVSVGIYWRTLFGLLNLISYFVIVHRLMCILDSIDSGKRVETTAEEGPVGRQAGPSTVSGRLFKINIMHAIIIIQNISVDLFF